MSEDMFNLDAAETAFFQQELTKVVSETNKKYPLPKYAYAIPVDPTAGGGLDSITLRMWDYVGLSKIIADGATDSPSVEVFGEETLVKVKELGNHYSYTHREIRQSMRAGRSIDSMRRMASMRADDMKHDQIAFEADGTKAFGGMYGIVYFPNTTKVASTNGAGGSPLWSLKTADEIVKDMVDMWAKINTDTKGTANVNTILMGTDNYSRVSTLKYGVDTSTTVKDYLEQKLGVKVEQHVRLQGMTKNPLTGAGGTFNVVMMYEKDPMVLRYNLCMAYTELPAKNEGRSVKIETSSETAGVTINYPLSVGCFFGC